MCVIAILPPSVLKRCETDLKFLNRDLYNIWHLEYDRSLKVRN